MSVLLGLVALLLSLTLGVAVLVGATWLGADYYVEWRTIQRNRINAKRGQTGWNYGAYRSPFPWHDHEDESEEERRPA